MPTPNGIGPLAGHGSNRSASTLDIWRYRRLAVIGDALPDSYRDELQALAQKYGPSVDMDDEAWEFQEWPGSQSPFDAAELAAKADEDLVATLASWTETGGWREPTVAGLRSQLENVIADRPGRLTRLAPRFIDLEPTYGTALLTTLTSLCNSVGNGDTTV